MKDGKEEPKKDLKAKMERNARIMLEDERRNAWYRFRWLKPFPWTWNYGISCLDKKQEIGLELGGHSWRPATINDLIKSVSLVWITIGFIIGYIIGING